MTFRPILVPVDPNQAWSRQTALPTAVAQPRANHARVVVMTVIPESGADDPEKRPPDSERELRGAMHARVPEDPEPQVVAHTASVHRQIRRTAHERRADPIVTACHRPAWGITSSAATRRRWCCMRTARC